MDRRWIRTGALLAVSAILFFATALASCTKGDKSANIPMKLPFGGVNVPVSGQKVTGKVDLLGWALAEPGIGSVSIYVDRTFVASCSTGLPRPDVAKAYPDVASSGDAGWMVTIDTTKLSPAWHELTIQAMAKDGATRDLASLPILVQR